MRRWLAIAALLVSSFTPAYAQMDSDFSIGGAIRIGESITPCDASAKGGVRFNSSAGGTIEFCNGSLWKMIGASGGAASPDRGIQFNSGGSLAATAGLSYSTSGLFSLQSQTPSSDVLDINNSDSTLALRVTFDSTNAPSLRLHDASGARRLHLGTNPMASPYFAVSGANKNVGNTFYGAALAIIIPNVSGNENGIYMGDASVANWSQVAFAAMTFYDQHAGGYGQGGLRFKTNDGTGLNTRIEIDKQGLVAFSSTGALVLNAGTTADRPAVPVQGMVRYNTTSGKFEAYGSMGWVDMMGSGEAGPMSAITAATGANAINNAAHAQSWSWNALTTGRGLSLGTSSLTSGSLLYLSATNNSAASNGSVLRIDTTGASSNAIPLVIAHGGASHAVRINDDGTPTDTTPFVIDGAGRVGIGTASPVTKLDLEGAIQLGDNGEACSAAGHVGGVRYDASNKAFQFCRDHTVGWEVLGATMLGTSATDNNPQISGDVTSGLFAPAAGTVGIATSGAEAVRVTPAQRVGVGRTSPQAKLDVNGGVRIGNNTDPCTGSNAGELIWNGANVQVCNGTNWTTLGTPACGLVANPILYAAQDNVALSTQVDSNIALVAGLGCTSANISVSGVGAPEYRICADATCTNVLQAWGVTVSSVQSGQYVQLRQTSSASQAVTHTATLTVGATTATWDVTSIGPKIMFITSTIYNGDLGGLSGADIKCQDRATAAGLPGTYKAWLSDSTTSAASRLNHATTHYKNTNNQIVQTNWTNLVGGSGLLNAIRYSELGVLVPSANIWTNTNTAGGIKKTNASLICNDWTLNLGVPYEGSVGDGGTFVSPGWTDNHTNYCNTTQRLLCIQQ